mgnify:CR=1 FL=1
MLLTREFFQKFAEKEIADSTTSTDGHRHVGDDA